MATPKASSTRKAHKKSHLGCAECKKRRIKCDETRPTCVACTTRNTVCSYNTFNIVDVSSFTNKPGDNRKEHSASSPLTSTLVTTPALSQDLESHRNPSPTHVSPPVIHQADDIDDATFRPRSLADLKLLHHWTRHAAESITAVPGLEETFRDHVLEEGFKHPYLLHSALALSALHADLNGTPLGVTRLRDVATGHYSTALRLYRSALANVSDDKCSALFMCAVLAAVTALALADRTSEDVVADLLGSCRLWIGIVSVSHHVVAQVRQGPFHLMIGHDNFVQPEEPADYAVRLLSILTDQLPHIGHEDRTEYEKLIKRLEQLFQYKFLGPLEVVRWLCQLDLSAIDLLQKRTELGDAILVIMGAILHDLGGYWWAHGLGEALAMAVIPKLGLQWSELKLLVSHIVEQPAGEVGKNVDAILRRQR